MPPSNQMPSAPANQQLPPAASAPMPPQPMMGMPPQPQPGMQPQMPAPPPQANQQTAQQTAQQATNQTTSQKSLLFSELRDGMIVMTDGSFRAIVGCESINFDLMSSQEREAVEYSYQNFLNSLLFPIQILVRSQRVDIAPYLDRLDSIRRSQDNMLLNILTEDYLNFVDRLSQEANIMDKRFFIIIPYYPDGDASKLLEQGKGFFSKIFNTNRTAVTRIDEATYDKAKSELSNRVESVMSGLYQVGVRSTRLTTQQLGELYYNAYNPDTSVNQPLVNFQDQTTTFVQKGQGEAPRLDTIQGGSL